MLAKWCSEAFINTKSYRFIVLLVVLWATLTPFAAEAYDFQDCAGCHESLEGASKREKLHDPFRENACEQCHAAAIAAALTESELKEQQRVTWLGESPAPLTRHAFLLPDSKVRELLVVDVKNNDGSFTRHEVAIPFLADLVAAEDSGQAPALSAVQVLQLKTGVFLSATIGWQTDTITDALVRYGEQELSQNVLPVSRFGREHQVVLPNLRPNRTYRFVAESRDLFGRSQASEPVTFSTADAFNAPTTVSPEPEQTAGDIGFLHEFRRHGDNFLLEVAFASPTLVYVGSRGQTRHEGMPNDEFHEGLSGKTVMSYSACIQCHQPHLHPLNVAPTKPGITIPPEFPTLSGGRITCTSCHSPHGSDFDFYMRKPDKQELCASCHPKWVKLK
jgi:predicted CXXCH cytochrome family protein